MSAPSVADTIAMLEGKLCIELSRLDADNPTQAQYDISNWLSNERIDAELHGLIDEHGRLTPLGAAIIRTLRGHPATSRRTAQQVLALGQLGIVAQATLLLIDPDDSSYILHIIGLSDEERILLKDLGVTDDGGNLTQLGIELVRDLKWMRH